jgi:hypothetical protein
MDCFSLDPHNYNRRLSTATHPPSIYAAQPRNSFEMTAQDQWNASYFTRNTPPDYNHPSALLSAHWEQDSPLSSRSVRNLLLMNDGIGITHVLTLYSPSVYPSDTLQVEESCGSVISSSQPPPYFTRALGTLPLFPSASTFENITGTTDAPPPPPAPLPLHRPPESGGCVRQPHGNRNVRFHPTNAPQQLARGMRKAWGPAAGSMNLESTVEELRGDGIDDEVISTVREIFSAGFCVGALMRKMTKEESRRYLNGETGQVYRALLRRAHGRFQCNLCHENAETMSWKHPRDVVRHLRRDHFGLGDSCSAWCVFSILGLI